MRIKGRDYPCRMTMGAMLRFKRETGKEVGDIKDTDLSLMATLIWCCVASACKADGVQFDESLDDFCDMVGTEEMQRINAALSGGGDAAPEADPKKKD